MISSPRGTPTLRPVSITALLCLLLASCGGENQDEYSFSSNNQQGISVVVPELSDKARLGKELFTASCVECHGANAGGSSQGPPLIDKIYEPGHHADISFFLAVQQGVRQHHWQFGNMPPREEVSADDVDELICYVRELQYANGIFTDPDGLVACQA